MTNGEKLEQAFPDMDWDVFVEDGDWDNAIVNTNLDTSTTFTSSWWFKEIDEPAPEKLEIDSSMFDKKVGLCKECACKYVCLYQQNPTIRPYVQPCQNEFERASHECDYGTITPNRFREKMGLKPIEEK